MDWISLESVRCDARGRGAVVKVNGEEVLFFELRKGLYRGGEAHSVDQHTLCLKGLIVVNLRRRGRQQTKVLKANDYVLVPADAPHLFFGAEDSVFLEWKLGKPKTTFYEPYRKVVEAQLK